MTRYADTLQQLAGDSPHALAVTEGPTHSFRYANPAFCRLVQTVGRDMQGHDFREVLPEPGDGGGPLALLDRVFSTGEPESDFDLERQGGGALWSYTVWPLKDEAGQPAGLAIEVIDRSGEAGARQQLQEMADQIRLINERLLGAAQQEQEWAEKAEAASRAKSEFLAMMSHELRTPLTGIVGYTDVLEAQLAGPLSRAQLEMLGRIRVCSTQLRELIDDVLCFSRLRGNTLTVRAERVDLCQLAREAAAIIEPSAATKGLRLTTATPDTPLTSDTDPRKVRQILLNLLSNAVKFTDSGCVDLAVSADDADVHMRVSDTGVGIAATDLERVFEPFTQTEAVTTRHHGGTGLGLAISRSLAVMLGGSVTVRSRPGEGSDFALHLPRHDRRRFAD
jgi:signal transduction histidine kinase